MEHRRPEPRVDVRYGVQQPQWEVWVGPQGALCQQQQLPHAGSASGGTRRLLLAAALLPAIPAGSPSSTPTAATLPAAQRRQAHTALHMRHKIAEREQY